MIGEVRGERDLRNIHKPSEGRDYEWKKHRMCLFWKKGHCYKGTECDYIHTTLESNGLAQLDPGPETDGVSNGEVLASPDTEQVNRQHRPSLDSFTISTAPQRLSSINTSSASYIPPPRSTIVIDQVDADNSPTSAVHIQDKVSILIEDGPVSVPRKIPEQS
jgi:hypothetical protein